MEVSQESQPDLTIGREFYEEHLASDVAQGFIPRYCLVFSLPLRFQLPFKNASFFCTAFTNQATAFIFDKFETVQHEAMLPDRGVDITELRTRVEAIAFFPENGEIEAITDLANLDDASYEFLYSHFSHLLNRLRSYLYAYRMLFEDSKTFLVSPEQFFMAFTRIYTLPDWNIRVSDSLVTCTNPSNYERIMTNVTDEHFRAIEALGFHLDRDHNKFAPTSQFFAEARRYLHLGHPRESVVFLGMSSESLLNALYHHIRAAEGVPELEIDVELEDTPLMRQIKRHISHALGGSWDMTDPSTPIGAWKDSVYGLRNRVVHGGYFPQMHEAISAFVTMVDFAEFVRERVFVHESQFPAAAAELQSLPPLFVHGQEGEHTFDIS